MNTKYRVRSIRGRTLAGSDGGFECNSCDGLPEAAGIVYGDIGPDARAARAHTARTGHRTSVYREHAVYFEAADA